MAGPAQAAALGSTRMFPAVLFVAYVPSTPTRLLLARIKATANATQDTQVKVNIHDKQFKHSNLYIHNTLISIRTETRAQTKTYTRHLFCMRKQTSNEHTIERLHLSV
jgi:hypothetical protein